jgi:hypothetical protein
MLSKRRRQGKRGNILLAMSQARPSMARNFILQNSKNAFGAAGIPAPRLPLVWLTNREMNRSSSER